MVATNDAVPLRSLCDLRLVCADLVRTEPIDQLDGRNVAPAHHIVPDTVVDAALGAVDQAKIREIGAVLALVGVLIDLLSILHQLDRGIAGWHLAGLLDGEAGLHLGLHEGPLVQLKVGILVELLLEDQPRLSVDLHPLEIANILSDEPFDRKYWYFLASAPIQLLAFGPVVKPGPRREIDRLADIEPRGEASVVRPGHREHKLARPLQSLVHLDLLLFKVGRRDHSHDVQQYIWVFLEEKGDFLLDCLFELLAVALRHTVPLLGRAPVRIVDRVEHQVLIVPTKRRIAHTYVQPWDIDA